MISSKWLFAWQNRVTIKTDYEYKQGVVEFFGIMDYIPYESKMDSLWLMLPQRIQNEWLLSIYFKVLPSVYNSLELLSIHSNVKSLV